MPSILMKDICRLCAKQGGVYVDVFGEEGTKQNLERKVRLCTPIIIKEDEDMPKQICLGCLNQLDSSYELYLTCVNAQTIIKKLLGKRQTRSSASLGSNAPTTTSGNCGLSDSLLMRLNVGEVSLKDFLADQVEPPSKKPRQANSNSFPEPESPEPPSPGPPSPGPPSPSPEDEDIKPVPGVDVPDMSSLVQNSYADNPQDGSMEAMNPLAESPFGGSQGAMVAINPSSLAAVAAATVPHPPTASLPPMSSSLMSMLAPAPPTATTMSYMVNGMDTSPIIANVSTLSNLVPGGSSNLYLANLSNMVSNQAVCGVSPVVREPGLDMMSSPSAQRVTKFEMTTDPSNQLTYATLQPPAASAPTHSQPGIYVQDGSAANMAFTSGEGYAASQLYSSPVSQTNPVVSSSPTVYGQSAKSDPLRVVYSNRSPVTTSLTAQPGQFLSGVALQAQGQQVSDLGTISHSSLASNSPQVQGNNKRTAASVATTDPTATITQKLKGSEPMTGQQQTQHILNPVQPREQLQQQLPLLKLPTSETSPEQESGIMELQQPDADTTATPRQVGTSSVSTSRQGGTSSSTPRQVTPRQPGTTSRSTQRQASTTNTQNHRQIGTSRHASPAGTSTSRRSGPPGTSTPRQAGPASGSTSNAANSQAASQNASSSKEKGASDEVTQMCEHCHKPFPPDILIHHRVLHFRDRFFSCISCGKNFRTEMGLDQHRCDMD